MSRKQAKQDKAEHVIPHSYMKIHLAYGKEGLDVEVPDKNLVKVLAIDAAPPLKDPTQAVWQSLKGPIGSPSLAEFARRAKRACIVVCDITRPVPNKILLPPILWTLEESGIQRNEIVILIATGLHRPSTVEELQLILGDAITHRYPVVHHRARAREEQISLGETGRKTAVFIDKAYYDADLKITVGFIEPHLMAGFSGGGKMVAIGCAGEETIKTLHSPSFLDDPLCCEGSIDRNPLHHELLEIAEMAGHDFIVDVSLDAERNITGVFSGKPRAAHAAGIEAVRKSVRATVPGAVDIVITTSAGFPLDLTYYQSIKGMTAALPAVKKGGMLILAAECAEGLGSEAFAAMATRFRSERDFDEWIHHHPVEIDQWQLQECVKAARYADIVLVAGGINEDQKAKLFVHSAKSVGEALERGLKRFGSDASIAVIPKGPYT
ncbi:MAG: nickel-dependent lactate racemase, partial [Bacteroidota bacterium]